MNKSSFSGIKGKLLLRYGRPWWTDGSRPTIPEHQRSAVGVQMIGMPALHRLLDDLQKKLFLLYRLFIEDTSSVSY